MRENGLSLQAGTDGGGDTWSVEIPRQFLEIEHPVLTVESGGVPDKDALAGLAKMGKQDDKKKLTFAAAPVRIILWDIQTLANGTEVLKRVNPTFDPPMVLGFGNLSQFDTGDDSSTDLSNLRCVYFDEAEQRWSKKGVARVDDPMVVKCSTTHLTLFSAAFEFLEALVECSNLDLLSEESFDRVWDQNLVLLPVL